MKKELCFVIDSVKVYLEQVLVDYIDVPIFFLCKGNEQYYLALCIDIDELEYIVVKPSLLEVYYLLHGKTPFLRLDYSEMIRTEPRFTSSGGTSTLSFLPASSCSTASETWRPMPTQIVSSGG